VALLAASATANATIWEVTLTKVMLGSNGRAATELKINPAPSFPADTPQIPLPTMRYNDATTTLTMTGKLDLRYQTTPTSGGRLFDHYLENLVINGATGDPSGTTSFSCENSPASGTAAGGFGQVVGANICGSYMLGDDYVDNSTLAYSGLGVTRTIAGDDAVSGDPQSIAAYALLTQNFTAGPGGTLVMQSADWNPTSSAGLQMTFSVGAVVGGGAGQGYPVKLVKYVQLSGTTESVLRWDGGPGCTNYATKTNCINPANTVMSSRGIMPSTATWDWNPTTGVLSSVGDFNSALTIGSNSMAPMVLGDRVTNLTLNTATSTTSATVYACAEGTFLATVGANGCLNTNIGDNFVDDSTVVYNVGGDPTCIKLTIGGDDTAMEGAPRGLITRTGNATCDTTDGAFNTWTVVQDDTLTGGQLIIASSNDITTPDGSYLIFDALPHAVDDTTDAIPTVATQIDVLANDLALAGPVTVAIGTQPSQGTATVVGSPGNQADVHVTYTANAGATGTDTFTYTVTNGITTGTGTVTVTILQQGSGEGQGYPVKLVKYYQQGTSIARWDGCSDYTQFSNCIKPGTTLANLGVTPSTATWNWDPATGILSSVGDFNSASTISSQAASQVVIGDSVTDLVINTTTGVTTASAYHCIEGTFLSSVGANGCLNTSTGDDFVDDSSAVYNVGGDATCIKVTIGGDDSAMEGAPRGVTTRAASVNCDATDGAFGPWSVAEDLTASGGQLKISNGPLNDANTGVLIFDALPRAVDDTTDAIPTVAKQIDVLANDIALADPVTVAINTAPTKGTATVVGSPGNAAGIHINYTGNAGATGTDSFIYIVTSGTTTTTGTVIVTLRNLGGARDDVATTQRNEPVTIDVAGNDPGFNSSRQLGLYINPLNGSATVVGSAIRYAPNPEFVGTDTFKYIIDDGTHVGIATVTVQVIDDGDHDGIADAVDNCLGRANADQRDTDGDGYGNACDADLDNSGTVNFGDLAIFHRKFGTADPDADFDGNGAVNFADLATFRALFGKPPGPAGTLPAS